MGTGKVVIKNNHLSDEYFPLTFGRITDLNSCQTLQERGCQQFKDLHIRSQW